MATYRVAELEGRLLNLAVAKAEGQKALTGTEMGFSPDDGVSLFTGDDDAQGPILWAPSTDWEQAGPIIERERICLSFGVNQDEFPGWGALLGPEGYQQDADAFGPTPLIAAMRAYVAIKLGDVVDLP